MSDTQTHMPCPVCKTTGGKLLVSMQNMPIFCNHLLHSIKEAQEVARGNIELHLCCHCFHIYNHQFNPDMANYQPEYENSLHFSKQYRDYAARQVQRLLQSYNLYGEEVVDIGCGKGDFLRMFHNMGNCTGTGFEPTATSSGEDESVGIHISPDIFSARHYHIPAKCYVSRHVLEHVANPGQFLKTIGLAMSDNAVLFLEVPNGGYMLEECSLWDIIYEHYSYFTPLSLSYLLFREGFRHKEPQSGFGGQFLFVDVFSQKQKKTNVSFQTEQAGNEIIKMAENFVLCCQARHEHAVELITTELQSGKKIVLWGAGSKGITLLNQLPNPSAIQSVVDINPRKTGKYIPGSAQLVVQPGFLSSIQPDTVLIMNDMYRKEIQTYLDSLNLSARIHSL